MQVLIKTQKKVPQTQKILQNISFPTLYEKSRLFLPYRVKKAPLYTRNGHFERQVASFLSRFTR